MMEWRTVVFLVTVTTLPLMNLWLLGAVVGEKVVVGIGSRLTMMITHSKRAE